MSIDIRRADELGEPFRRRIAEVLVRGFAEDFAYFSTDPDQLADAFEHMILLDRFYVALVDGEPAAIASLTEGRQECFAPRWAPIRRRLGLVHGTITYLVVRSQFLGSPPDARPGLAEIGFVTTAPAYQGRGVATALMRHLLALPGIDELLLRDIKDTNVAALALYRKLGFEQSASRPMRSPARAGFSEYVSMRRSSTRA
ncbi:GNAT family N-acetyltransferase [Pseudactinotalea suaedae]|uniref:GNAT family N-acetyltransferase n=1 Tax=Pseudactinotalea suaedae TaxID=1524924 RepID=UPI0012E0DA72|nr:GNAT family N-acetyltransferase [Pseudactinotalea suaedae]